MKRRMFGAAAALGLLLCCLLTACAPLPQKNKYTAYSMEYFDTVITITGYEDTQQRFDEVSGQMLQLLGEYHRLYTIYHRYEGLENLCTVNDVTDGAHRTVKVDGRIVNMLLYAKQMYRVTGGMVNVAMGSVLSLWHEHRTVGTQDALNASLPTMNALQQASAHTDIDALVIDVQNSTVTLTDPLMKLDVGAIAKGYATEQVARQMERQGVTGYVLNVGGNIRTIGTKPDGESWTVGIEDPDGGDFLTYLQIADMSVVTSGSYQRYYYVNGKAYHHIIHPDTLMPAEGFTSVSVLCGDAGMGDALSTALFCMPLSEGMALVESLDGVEVLWVAEDGTQTASAGWTQYVRSE